MPRAEEGDRVKVRYICRLEDGTLYDFSDRDSLEFIIGEGDIMPELEKGVLGMKPGQQKTIRIPAFEVEEFRYTNPDAPNEAGFPAGTTPGDEEQYDIGTGEEADDDEESSVEGLHVTTLSGERDPDEGNAEEYIFEIELLEIEPDAGLQLGDSTGA
ncbi:MAG TPA: FKBP-type peptidyl-prolyl cis-trans isomerase [Verrucomicrobiae bacterium]|nr:FKBP-type peptidyl-prolyl cis-trans isomerase [Verrucomicrobiae bacterium]